MPSASIIPTGCCIRLRRMGAKGAGEWQQISWDEALDMIAEAFLEAEAAPRLARPSGRISTPAPWATCSATASTGCATPSAIRGQFDTICTNPAWTGYFAGTGRLAGPDPREMAQSDCVVIWGTNAVNTQVNVMTHAVRARKERGAKIVVIDIYDNATMKQADLGLILKPGTDGALACAIMHVLFRDGLADRDYLERYADVPAGLEAHLAVAHAGLGGGDHRASGRRDRGFRRLVGKTKRTFFRLGYGFTRQRNGAVNMHAALLDRDGHRRLAVRGRRRLPLTTAHLRPRQDADRRARRTARSGTLDQSQIGRVLTGDADGAAAAARR